MGLIQLGGGKGEQTAEGPPLASPGGEISFSVRAIAEARKLLEREGGKLFRVGVTKGGCSGWNYELATAEEVASDDPYLTHVKAFDLPEQEKKLVLDTAGVVALGELLAKRFLSR